MAAANLARAFVINFGDGTTVADGKIVLKFRLINVRGKNFYGDGMFNYSLNGFTSGYGIEADQFFYYPIGNNMDNGGDILFDNEPFSGSLKAPDTGKKIINILNSR